MSQVGGVEWEALLSKYSLLLSHENLTKQSFMLGNGILETVQIRLENVCTISGVNGIMAKIYGTSVTMPLASALVQTSSLTHTSLAPARRVYDHTFMYTGAPPLCTHDLPTACGGRPSGLGRNH